MDFRIELCGQDGIHRGQPDFPAIMVFACVGFMFGSGGSALVAKTMGEGQTEKANRLFLLSSFPLSPGAYCFPPWVTFLCPFLPPPWVHPVKCLHAVSLRPHTSSFSPHVCPPAGIPIVHGHRRKTFSRSLHDDPLRCDEYRS